MLVLLGMQCTPLLPLLSRVVASDRVISMGHVELKCVLTLN